ncbi:MAG: hypothetical protein AMS16_06265 [Planctomycetes bacterium DG_58]|nr:MAG: hypothetical protein AMS16_06265 [Planctomycetes bacterium DG_58]
MSRRFGYLALAAFVLSALVHVLTFFPHAAIVSGAVWLLHVGLFVFWFPMVILGSLWQYRLCNRLLGSGDYESRSRARTDAAWRMVRLVPFAARCVVVFLFAYTFVNFALFVAQGDAGTASAVDGQYFLYERGVRSSITEREYVRIRSRQVRGFSGHWMLFYFVPALFFIHVLPGVRREVRRVGVEDPGPPNRRLQPGEGAERETEE